MFVVPKVLHLRQSTDTPELLSYGTLIVSSDDESFQLEIDNFRIIRSTDGEGINIGYPDRPNMMRCRGCAKQTHVTYKHCGHCGYEHESRFPGILYRKIVTPVNSETRAIIKKCLVATYDNQVRILSGAPAEGTRNGDQVS